VELAEQALMLGAHVVVEKPLAADADSTAALLAVARERRLLLVPVHQFVFQRGVRRLLSGRDRFGTLVRCVFEAVTAGAERMALDPDDLVADILPHPLALFSRLTESGLAEAEWVVLRPTSGELRALTDVAGTTFEIVIYTHGRPTRATLDVLGTTASAHADLFHGFAVIEPGSATRARKLARPFALAGATLGRASANLAQRGLSREVAYPGLRELVRSTHEAIAAGKPSPIDEREIIGVAAARDAILKTVKAAPPVRSE
jgi:predicted dehydrogenase